MRLIINNIIVLFVIVIEFIGYSDFIDKEMRQPGCEALPLGVTFQNHVKLFTK